MHFNVAEVQLHFSLVWCRGFLSASRSSWPYRRRWLHGLCFSWATSTEYGYLQAASKQTGIDVRVEELGANRGRSRHNKMAHWIKRSAIDHKPQRRQISQHFSAVRWQKKIFNRPWLGRKWMKSGLSFKFFASTRRFRIQSGPTPQSSATATSDFLKRRGGEASNLTRTTWIPSRTYTFLFVCGKA
jgi:hypothetical protein